MHCDQITADTALPSLRGEQAHYPRMRASVVVTMPGPDHAPLVVVTLCGNAYARRPRTGDPTELGVCLRCTELRARQQAEQHRSAP